MATDLTQDTVLRFLQTSGGSVKNADLLLHFRSFIRDHADRNRNRELFKKFVNSVATVKQIDGVSYVVLKKKFKGHVPGGGGDEGGSSGPLRLHAWKSLEPSPEYASPRPAMRTEKLRQKEEATPAPPGETARKTVLPVADILLNNNNVKTIFNVKQQQVNSSPDSFGKHALVQIVNQSAQKTQLKTLSLSQPPATNQGTNVGQHKGDCAPLPATHHREVSQQHPEILRGREAHVELEGALHQEPPQHLLRLHPEVTPRRIRHRQSYKTAVSYDEDEEEVPMRRGSGGGQLPLNSPLCDIGRAISASSPCIIDPPAPASDASSSSSERKTPKIYIQDVEEEMLAPPDPGQSLETGRGLRGQCAGPGLELGYIPGEMMPSRRSLPLEAERCMPALRQATEVAPHHNINQDHRYSQPAGVQLELNQGQTLWLSSRHNNVFSSSDWTQPGSPRASGNSSPVDLQARAGEPISVAKIQEVPQLAQRKCETATYYAEKTWHHSTGHLCDNQEETVRLSPLHHSTNHLRIDRDFGARVMPWHLSTGDLYDDHEEADSSDGSTSSPQLRQRPALTKRLSSRLRSRMCRSMGADLDQFLQEETSGGGNETARLNRLHRISSSLSLRHNLSSSSLSSCSTPPHYSSLANLVEGADRTGDGLSLPTTTSSSTIHHEGRRRQSLVPLEPKEHAWLVKGAAGNWPDIYSLFREDSSLLNRRDFISGFTVLHWIAKHGDHRVLNTLWYGVQKAGLTFDVNARSTSGHTPLHIATIHSNKNIIRLLVGKFNADVRLRDMAGKKPWQYLSRTAPLDIFQLLGAPARAAVTGEGGVGRDDSNWELSQQRRRRHHHLSSASSGRKPLSVAGTVKVKRSSSIAAFLKHKSLHRFYGHHSDSPV